MSVLLPMPLQASPVVHAAGCDQDCKLLGEWQSQFHPTCSGQVVLELTSLSEARYFLEGVLSSSLGL